MSEDTFQPPNKPRSARYELLDPLRGIAILAVMLLHFFGGNDSGDSVVFDNIWPLVQHGYLGVQLFFVISGYCITAALYGAMNKKTPLRYFVIRRLRRIFPPFWISMMLVVVLGLITITVLKTPKEVVFPLTKFDWLCNFFLIQGPLHAVDANLVYWSLSIELQFYLVMAIALFCSRQTEAWLVLVSVLFLAIGHLTTWKLWGTVIVYWSEFLCGIAAYFWLTRRMKWEWTPTLLVGLVLLDALLQARQYEVLMQPDGRLIKPLKLVFCLGCMSLMLGLRRFDEVICRWKPMRLLSWFGLISYSLYLTHVPVGTRIFNLSRRMIGLDGMKWMLPAAASVIICTIFGWLFFRLFEKPWLNSSAQQNQAAAPAVQEGIVT